MISLTGAVPIGMVEAANHLCRAFGTAGSEYTFGTAWRSADGETDTHSVCHAWVPADMPALIQSGELPANLPAVVDEALALAALAAVLWWERGDPAPPLDRLILSTAGDPHALFAAWGLSPLPVEG